MKYTAYTVAALIAFMAIGCDDPTIDPIPISIERATSHDGDGDGDGDSIEPLPADEYDEPRIDEAYLARTERTFEYDPRQDILPSAVARARAVRVRRMRAAQPLDFATLVPPVTNDGDLMTATQTALLRISGTEVEFQNENDVIAFWQIATALRARHCDNSRFASNVRTHISQCRTDDGRIVAVANGATIEDAEETHWSILRRLSPYVMGARHTLRNHRQRWARRVVLTCDDPGNYTGRGGWAALVEDCEATSTLVQGLVDGSIRRRVTRRARPVSWGGRCGRPGYACDDPHACRRGLAQIPDTGTSNALWCRPGSRGCSEPVVRDGIVYSDPVCAALNIPAPSRMQHLARDAEADENAESDDGPLAG